MSPVLQHLGGAGLGLRRPLIAELLASSPESVGFLEIAPENWINLGGRMGKSLRQCTERWPFICHGLSLSIGAPAPLNTALVHDIKAFMAEHGIGYYSEHLSYCGDTGQLYDLLPIPFTQESVTYVAERIRICQDILGQRIAMENASYYCAPGQELSEAEFLSAVLQEADCDLLLDVNNVYVNSQNHGYDPIAFLQQLPAERVSYFHIAGHHLEPDFWRIDTHGAPVITDVWQLLAASYQQFGVKPTLLERDFNLPPLAELVAELEQIQQYQNAAAVQAIATGASA